MPGKGGKQTGKAKVNKGVMTGSKKPKAKSGGMRSPNARPKKKVKRYPLNGS